MSKIERDNTMLDLAIKVILEFGDERYDNRTGKFEYILSSSF